MSSSTREKIFEVAGPVFAEKGFQSTTVRELCDKAGVNVASINYYFGDKQNLYSELVRNAQKRCESQHPLPQWEADTLPEQRLYDMVLTLLQQLSVAQTAPWEVQLLMREVLNPSRGGVEVAEEYFTPFFKILLDVIESMSIEPQSLSKLAEIGLSVLSQCLIYRYGSETIAKIAPNVLGLDGKPDVESLALQITHFSIAGIKGNNSFKPETRLGTQPTINLQMSRL